MSDGRHTVEGMNQWQPLPLWEDEISLPAAVDAADAQTRNGSPRAWWTEAVGVFDLETTGVDVTADRIVTAHVGLLGADGAVLRAQSWLTDPGIPIPDGAAAVHGITTEHARAHGASARDVVAEVVAAVRGLLDAGIPVVAYNAPFDFSLLKHEAMRHEVTPLMDPSPVIDPLVLDKAHDRFRKGKRTLEAVAAHYGVPLVGAHDAAADAIAAGRLALALGRRFDVDAALHELHAQQIGWARAQADGLTEYFIRIGRLDADDRLDGSWPIR